MKYGLIGEKLGHSFSKEIHEMIGYYKYEIHEVARCDIDKFMKEKDFVGINVTIPYKETVIPYLDEISPQALSIGAVNTIVNINGKLYGHNTDYFGMLALIKKNNIDCKDKKVLILGTGGTSKTAYAVVKDLGAKTILKASINGEVNTITYEEAVNVHNDVEVIINTTPVGMYPKNEGLIIDIKKFNKLDGVVDVVYNPLRTNLILNAKELNIPCEGGLYMLVAQAVYACGIFLEKDIDLDIINNIFDKIIKDKENIVYDYYGLNHFGWFTSIEYKGKDIMDDLRAYIKEKQILLPEAYLKDKAALAGNAPKKEEGEGKNRHAKGSWYYVWKGVYEIMENFPDTLPNTYLNYYLQQKEFVEHSNPERTRANEVMETREKNLFEGIDKYLETGIVEEKVFYAGSHGDWIADLAIALKNDTKARFLVITQNRGAIPNMPYDAMVEIPAYIGKNGPEVIARNEIPLFQQGLMMQQLNSEKLLVEGCIEGSYQKVLEAFTLNKTVPSMTVAKEILDEMIEANKEYWPELK